MRDSCAPGRSWSRVRGSYPQVVARMAFVKPRLPRSDSAEIRTGCAGGCTG